MKKQIGWVIPSHLASYKGCKVYLSENIARRYAGKLDVVPAFIETTE